jgi:hypothetical protein
MPGTVPDTVRGRSACWLRSTVMHIYAGWSRARGIERCGLAGVGWAARPARFRQGDGSSCRADSFPSGSARMIQLTPGGWPAWAAAPGRAGRRFSLLVAARRDQVRGGTRLPASFGSIWGGVCPARFIAGAGIRCGQPGAQAIPEAVSGLYPGSSPPAAHEPRSLRNRHQVRKRHRRATQPARQTATRDRWSMAGTCRT